MGPLAGSRLRRRGRRAHCRLHRQDAPARGPALAGDRRHCLCGIRHAALRGSGGGLRSMTRTVLRKATLADVPQLEALIARSARGLSAEDYRHSQIEGALRGAFGVDTQLLADQTYFVVEEDGRFVGCGGWSFRATLFGGDARARRGIGTLLLEHCENEARAHGFSRVELMATLPGVKLYAARGYVGAAMVHFDVG